MNLAAFPDAIGQLVDKSARIRLLEPETRAECQPERVPTKKHPAELRERPKLPGIQFHGVVPRVRNRHPRESGRQFSAGQRVVITWIPAFAGMTARR